MVDVLVVDVAGEVEDVVPFDVAVVVDVTVSARGDGPPHAERTDRVATAITRPPACGWTQRDTPSRSLRILDTSGSKRHKFTTAPRTGWASRWHGIAEGCPSSCPTYPRMPLALGPGRVLAEPTRFGAPGPRGTPAVPGIHPATSVRPLCSVRPSPRPGFGTRADDGRGAGATMTGGCVHGPAQPGTGEVVWRAGGY